MPPNNKPQLLGLLLPKLLDSLPVPPPAPNVATDGDAKGDADHEGAVEEGELGEEGGHSGDPFGLEPVRLGDDDLARSRQQGREHASHAAREAATAERVLQVEFALDVGEGPDDAVGEGGGVGSHAASSETSSVHAAVAMPWRWMATACSSVGSRQRFKISLTTDWGTPISSANSRCFFDFRSASS